MHPSVAIGASTSQGRNRRLAHRYVPVCNEFAISPDWHPGKMTETIYHVVPQKNNLFAVEMTPVNGRLRLIPDFRDKADADAWIVQTARMLHGLDPIHKLLPRRHSER
jgi:hypothetical protein